MKTMIKLAMRIVVSVVDYMIHFISGVGGLYFTVEYQARIRHARYLRVHYTKLLHAGKLQCERITDDEMVAVGALGNAPVLISDELIWSAGYLPVTPFAAAITGKDLTVGDSATLGFIVLTRDLYYQHSREMVLGVIAHESAHLALGHNDIDPKHSRAMQISVRRDGQSSPYWDEYIKREVEADVFAYNRGYDMRPYLQLLADDGHDIIGELALRISVLDQLVGSIREQ